MAKFQDQYDAAFLGILQNEGQIAGFLDAIFSFLFRRTDFYVLLTSKEDKMGFPPGVAEKLVLKAFKKYEKAARQQQALHKKQKEQASAVPMEMSPPVKPKTKLPTVDFSSQQTAEQPKVETVETSESASTSNLSKPVEDAVHKEQVSSDKVSSEDKHPSANGVKEEAAKEDTSQMDKSETTSSGSSDETAAGKDQSKKPKTDDSDDDDSEIARQQKIFQANPDSYNGAVRDKYSWSQSITDLDMKIFVPQHIRKGKEVQVEIHRKHITARCKTPSGEWNTLIDDDLPWEINKEQSLWSLEPGKAILVNLEKVQERWWECVLASEPKINVRKIDASRPMSDLDDEAQAKIEELMYNEHQKRLGLPQSHEKKVHDILRKAWDAEGSPFKGQPFDPTKLNITPDGAMNIGGH